MKKAKKLPTDLFIDILDKAMDVLEELSDKVKVESDSGRYRHLKVSSSMESIMDEVLEPVRLYLVGPFVPLDETSEDLSETFSEYCDFLKSFVLEDLTKVLPGSLIPDRASGLLDAAFERMRKTMFDPKEQKSAAIFKDIQLCFCDAADELRVIIGQGNKPQKVVVDRFTEVGKKELRSAVGKPSVRNRSQFRTQEQVAHDTRFTRKTINKWEREQTSDDSNNRSNKYGYYKSLRTDPERKGAYRVWVKQVLEYKEVKNRKMSFVAFRDEWWKHNPSAIEMLHLS